MPPQRDEPTKAGRRGKKALPGRRLFLLGSARLLVGGEALKLERKDSLLLAWLALEGPTPRARLAALMFPDADEARARNGLRQRLFLVKKRLAADLVIGGESLRLAEDVTVDTADPSAAGELLDAVDASDLVELSAWLRLQRARRAQARADWLAAAAARAEGQGDLARALESARRAVELDPLSEPAHRRVMRLHYLRGDLAAARAEYDELRELLGRELGVRPARETEEMRRQLGEGAMLPALRRPVPMTVLRPPRLVGRDAEWGELNEAWSAGAAAIVVAEAGMGKTRLLCDVASARGNAVLIAARPGDARVAYALLTRLARALVQQLRDGLGASTRGGLARLLPELGEAAPITGDSARARFISAIEELVRAARARGVGGIVVDDLQFADTASVDVLQHLIGADVRLAWLAAYRPAEITVEGKALIEELLQARRASQLWLHPLTAGHVAELIASLAVPELDSVQLAAAITARTGGNPLFILETLKTLLVQGQSPAGGLPVATSLAALIDRRIGQLSVQAVKLARCAAVAGQDFSADLAEAVMQAGPLELADAWNELEAAQIFRDSAFAHDLISESALASLPAPIARQLHVRVAHFLHEHGGEPAREAEHWSLAESWANAAPRWLEAAQRAADAALRREQAQLLERAAEAFARAGDGERRFEALLQRARALAWVDFKSAHEAIEELQSLPASEALRLGADVERARLLIKIGRHDEGIAVHQNNVETARRLGLRDVMLVAAQGAAASWLLLRRSGEALEMLLPYRELVAAEGSPGQQAEYFEVLASVLSDVGRLSEAAEAARSSIEAAQRAGRDDILAEALNAAALINWRMGRGALAVELQRQSCERRAKDENLQGQAVVGRAALGLFLMRVDRYAEAIPLIEDTIEVLAATGSRFWLHHARIWLAYQYLHLGQHARVLRSIGEEGRDALPHVRGWHLLLRAALAAQTRDAPVLAKARVFTRQAIALVGADDFVGAIFRLAHAAVEEPRAGIATAESICALPCVRERHGLRLTAQVVAARAHAALNEMAQAVRCVREALTLMELYDPEQMYRGEVWQVAVRVLRLAGEAAAADATLAAARAWIERTAVLHVPPEFRDSFLTRNPFNRELLAVRRGRPLPARS